ncbi:MAG: HxlR family transcriptional regulator [Acidobacteria bacterium SCN 69-37]|nr:MAG: HxlR family transcriptional regulator [Acidobacteria bacterium SCN 69-37]
MTQPSPSSPRLTIRRMVEDVVGCKWTLHVLAQVRAGVNRPGQLVRSAEGLTTKVLNERLVKLVRYGVLERHAYPEIPPRVEYHLTPLGTRLDALLDAIDALQRDVDADRIAPAARALSSNDDDDGRT